MLTDRSEKSSPLRAEYTIANDPPQEIIREIIERRKKKKGLIQPFERNQEKENDATKN